MSSVIKKTQASRGKFSAYPELEVAGLPEVRKHKLLLQRGNLICHLLLWLAKFA